VTKRGVGGKKETCVVRFGLLQVVMMCSETFQVCVASFTVLSDVSVARSLSP